MFIILKKSQITLPESIVKQLKLQENSFLKCTVKNGEIILTPYLSAKQEYSKLEIFCFKKLAVLADGRTVLITNRKAMELIAFLVCQTDACADKVITAESLWTESLPENAANNLYKATESIKNLQKQQIYMPIKSLRGNFKLLKEYIYCDLWEFEELYNSKNIKNWEKAEKMYTGILLYENGYSWASTYEGRYDIMYIEILEYLCSHYTRTGDKKNRITIA